MFSFFIYCWYLFIVLITHINNTNNINNEYFKKSVDLATFVHKDVVWPQKKLATNKMTKLQIMAPHSPMCLSFSSSHFGP